MCGAERLNLGGDNVRRDVSGTWVNLVQADIVTVPADVIVNAANAALAGGGGVDGAIHRAAGPALHEECRQLPFLQPGVRCPTGEVRTTSAGRLHARYVVHAVGPIYDSRAPSESSRLLAAAYRASLAEVRRLGCSSVVVPALSTGAFRFPIGPAARVAAESVVAELRAHPGALDSVTFALFSARDDRAFQEAFERALGPST